MDADLRSGPLAVAGWVCQADNLLQMFCKVYISKYTGKIRHVLISTLVRSGTINNPVSLPYQHVPGGQATTGLAGTNKLHLYFTQAYLEHPPHA